MSRSWTQIDWDAPRPDTRALEVSRRALRFVPVNGQPDSATVLLREFRSLLTNGGAELAMLAIENHDRTTQWFLSRNRFEEYGFVRCLLDSTGLSAALPQVPADALAEQDRFAESSPLTLDGEIAAQLVWGGAYGRFQGGGARAKRLGTAFCADLILDRYDDFRVDVSDGAWSSWFQSPAWNHTWVVTDRRLRQVTLLCLTDVD